MPFGTLGNRNTATGMPTATESGTGREPQIPYSPQSVKSLSPSPIAASMQVPSEPTRWDAPYVHREQDVAGMRYLDANGMQVQPLQALGAGGNTRMGIAVWDSDFQPNLHSRHNWGFYDKLFQAGYPGFNLALSFKTQQNPSTNAGGGSGVSPANMEQPTTYNLVVNVMRGIGTIITPQKPAQGQPGG